jgi:UDP-glucose:glycoprotein glucosyltransferase
MRIRLLELI